MWVWRNTQEQETETLGVARAALEGRVGQDLLKEAIRMLLASGQADRLAVWVEITDYDVADSGQPRSFRGIVAEKDGEATPAEWSRLSPQPPLPAELLVSMRTVEQDVDDLPDNPLIGALIEMRRALWVPVQVHTQLRGVLFAGSRKKQALLPRALLESVAAELALAMELQDERRLARKRHHDSRRMLAALAGSESPNSILAGIVKDCTRKGNHEGEASAVFAAIGRLVDAPKTRKSSIHPPTQSMRFAWQSGAAAWIRTLEGEELSAVWRRALECHSVAGSEPGIASPSGEVARLVAWPVEAAGEALGALVAGVRRNSASLGALERLELSAALAGPALFQLKRGEEAAELELRHKELLAALEKQPDRSEQEDAGHAITAILNVIEWLEEGVVLVGPRQEIRALNSRFGQMIGLAPEELARIKTLDDLVAAFAARTADAKILGQSWRSLDLTRSAVREELHLVRPVARLLERAARPILDEKVRLSGVSKSIATSPRSACFNPSYYKPKNSPSWARWSLASRTNSATRSPAFSAMRSGFSCAAMRPATPTRRARSSRKRSGPALSCANCCFPPGTRAPSAAASRSTKSSPKRWSCSASTPRLTIFACSSIWTRCSRSCTAMPGSSSKCS